jgi:hypothetical protein
VALLVLEEAVEAAEAILSLEEQAVLAVTPEDVAAAAEVLVLALLFALLETEPLALLLSHILYLMVTRAHFSVFYNLSMTVTRTYNIDIINDATKDYKQDLTGFYPKFWLGIYDNVALTNDNKDVALFDRHSELENAVTGHYFFHSRGKQALKAAKEMIREIFTGPYNVTSIMGLTPLEKKGALWMNRQLGFRHEEEVDTTAGPCRFVLLTKQEWELLDG